MSLKNYVHKPVALFILFLLMLFAQPAFAQLPRVASVKINPANPVKNDPVQIITTALHSSGDVFGTHQLSVDTVQKKITIDLIQCAGLLTVIGAKSDTFNLGKLPVGTYQVVTYLFVSQYDAITGNCGNVYVSADADTSHFSITQNTGFSGISGKQELLVFPNPVQSTITVTLSEYQEDYMLHLYSVTGQEMITRKMDSSNLTIDMTELENGIYFLILRNKQGTCYHKVIKNSNHK